MANKIQFPSMHLRGMSIAFFYLAILSKVMTFPTTFESLDFSLQITVPITTTLPTFLLGRKYKTENQNSQPYYRMRRSIQDGYGSFQEVPKNDLNGIFSHLGLHNVTCQRKLICLITQNPEKYSPISQIIFRQLDSMHQELSRSEMNQSSSKWQYMDLYDTGKGMSSPLTNCSQTAASCDKHPDENIDWNTINAWQAIMNFIRVEFK